MHSRCIDVLFFHSPGSFSFSGTSLSQNFFHRLAEPSTSRSRLAKASSADSALRLPHDMLLKKSTGLTTLGTDGALSKKSSSAATISPRLARICSTICEAKMSLSRSNRPRET